MQGTSKVLLTEPMVSEVADRNGVPVSMVVAVQDGFAVQVRRMDPFEARKQLTLLIPKLANGYGNVSVEGMAFKVNECIKMMFSKFKMLSLDEVSEAYRMWAEGQLNLGREAEMFGNFNAKQFGSVLTAYCEVRKGVYSDYLKKRSELIDGKMEEWKKLKRACEFMKEFCDKMREGREKWKSWREVPGHWFVMVWERKWVELDKRKIESFKVRAALAYEEELRMREESGQRRNVRFKVDESSRESEVRSIAGKMVVFDMILKNEDFVIPERLEYVKLGDGRVVEMKKVA